MDGWEYQVIHINVEPPRPPGPPTAAEGPAAAPQPPGEGPTARPVFSQSFLKKEFPQFYEKPAPEGSAGQSQHPAQQLQAFLNGHGAQGWELVGVFPVGTLTMMFFRRPKSASPAAAAVARSSAAPGPLEEVFRRLDQLEERLRSKDATGNRPDTLLPQAMPQPMPQPDAGSGPNRSPNPDLWVSPAQLARLADATPLPSSQAALAIGLRSAASLANLGARYGYTPGLSKRGPNGMVAIYTGAGSADKGGKERRLWIVVPSSRLVG